MRTISLGALVAAVLLTAGCLRKDTTHTLYLDPDGTVRWTATELDVYSDEEDPARRLEEEQAYIGAALIGAHGVAEGLKALRPDGVIDTRVLRDERPFHVMTETRFIRTDRLAERLLHELGVVGKASLSFDDGRMILNVTIDYSRPITPSTSPFIRLAHEADRVRIVLTDGRFGPTVGFDIADGNSASLSEEWIASAQSAFEQRTAVELMLSWQTGDR